MRIRDSVIIGIVFLALIVVIYSAGDKSNKETIYETIIKMNGTVTSIEEKSIFSDQPFHWVNTKGDRIYKITYEVNRQEKIGWVIFRVFSTDWQLQ